MAITNDRVGELIEGVKRNRRVLVSPEGVPMDIVIAGNGERLVAFVIDLALMIGCVVLLYYIAQIFFFAGTAGAVAATLVMFIWFLARNFYFSYFELAWQGRTPGKRSVGLRVINREGGELTPSAVIARNLTREIEFFLPMSLVFGLDSDMSVLKQLALLGWVAIIASLPLWSRERLRAGDLIGGTQVIAMPKRVLLGDLTLPSRFDPAREAAAYAFSHEQLAIYGAFELQVLEEFLRRPATHETEQLLRDVCEKICRKIDWEGTVPSHEARRFLTDFYAAERAELERGKLYGQFREDKHARRT